MPLSVTAQSAMTWTGDTDTASGFMTGLATSYETKKRKHIELKILNTSAALASVADGSSDLAGSVRLPRTDHPKEALLNVVPVAWDALVVITHKSNLIGNISLRDLKRVLTGEIKLWSELMSGGKGTIRLLRRKDRYAGVDADVQRIFFPNAPADFQLPGEALNDSTAVIKTVAEDPAALAISMFSHARRQPIHLVAVEGVPVQRATIIDGSYLLYQPVYFVHKRSIRKRNEMQRFLRFLSGSDAKRVLTRNGMVPYVDGLGLVGRQLNREERIRNLTGGE